MEILKISESQDAPIGVFDSGTGGLKLEKFSLDVFDNITGQMGDDDILDFAANISSISTRPNAHGNYDAEGKSDYLRELVIKDALFLLNDNYTKLNSTGVRWN